jgi:hypothetical protein
MAYDHAVGGPPDLNLAYWLITHRFPPFLYRSRLAPYSSRHPVQGHSSGSCPSRQRKKDGLEAGRLLSPLLRFSKKSRDLVFGAAETYKAVYREEVLEVATELGV